MRTLNFLYATSPVPSPYFINKIKPHLMSSLKHVFPMLSDSSAGTQTNPESGEMRCYPTACLRTEAAS